MDPRTKEAYAIVSALRKWAGHIGLQPVCVCTDHQSLRNWHTECVDTPSGPAARVARWHETFSKFDLSVVYVPGKDNKIADVLSRWVYPASRALQDVSVHWRGSSLPQKTWRSLFLTIFACLQLRAIRPVRRDCHC